MNEYVTLICPKCGNKKSFYKEVRIIAKVKVSHHGKRGKRAYDEYEDEDYEPVYCSNCGTMVHECLYCN